MIPAIRPARVFVAAWLLLALATVGSAHAQEPPAATPPAIGVEATGVSLADGTLRLTVTLPEGCEGVAADALGGGTFGPGRHEFSLAIEA